MKIALVIYILWKLQGYVFWSNCIFNDNLHLKGSRFQFKEKKIDQTEYFIMKGNLKGPASTLDIKYEALKVFLKDIEIDQTL